ncbi:chemotaxis protein CheW [Bacillus swezeyi]|uniref:Chemotaxis protein CheW n=1 Tax=Bacillus swezeyi TaxID=1925020 RepID=A0A1R1QUC9_9BACI|nr:chemotaxis protein CheW [Bacillus swezeyi]KAA6452845.1 chemotaxis protein CheW [Bacillus swezeyi]KAA6476535.1 chemotaxis protein CheW [Bacillus swezeyi]MEC1260889.1 chemotaxis protein CheW [Bacillus swezeyi]MED1741840.1 chemotaxis protein CheW [Bacillus swezeyi]MED2928826.1 chemotaxis protein CheW [Bacillus swezeyi]
MTIQTTTGEKMIVFKVNHKEYAISVSEVMSIEKWQHPTRVPGVEPYICGVINLRGVVTPVIDLRKRIEAPGDTITDETRIIIITHQDIEVGWVVDEANDVITVEEEEIESAPETVGKDGRQWIKGIVKQGSRLLNLIDSEAVLNRKSSLVAASESAKK